MGNCMIREESVHWGGEEWDFSSSSPPQVLASSGSSSRSNKPTMAWRNEEEVDLPLQKHHHREPNITSSSSSSSSYSYNSKPTTTEKTVKEVKIKISKKQLEELLGDVRVEGLSIQQVLHQLMKAGDHYDASIRSWRPNLKSIPE